MARVGYVFCFLLCFSTLRAWDVTVGRSFKITGLTRAQGNVVLPLERGQYANIRVLDLATYAHLAACAQDCVLEGEVTPVLAHLRPVRTQARMWVAEVDFGPSWRMSCLVIQTGSGFDVKFPAHVTFLDAALQARTRELILQAVVQEHL